MGNFLGSFRRTNKHRLAFNCTSFTALIAPRNNSPQLCRVSSFFHRLGKIADQETVSPLEGFACFFPPTFSAFLSFGKISQSLYSAMASLFSFPFFRFDHLPNRKPLFKYVLHFMVFRCSIWPSSNLPKVRKKIFQVGNNAFPPVAGCEWYYWWWTEEERE